jgi:two-component system OmpR family response regulator
MDESRVLFIGTLSHQFDYLRSCIEDEGLGGVDQMSAPSVMNRDFLVGADAVIFGPDITVRRCVELCRGVQASSGASITVISKELDEVDELRLIVAGVCFISFLPIRPRVIAARLAGQISRHEGEGPDTALSFRGLQAFPVEHLVTFDGEPLDLTKTEFQLLIHLMHSPRRVHTHAALSRWLWDDDSEVDHHRLEAHISRLRKKVTQGGGPSIVSSVRGVGYRLMTDVQLADAIA